MTSKGACKLPLHRRVTSQVMRHWAQHQAIADNAPSARQHHLEALLWSQAFNTGCQINADLLHVPLARLGRVKEKGVRPVLDQPRFHDFGFL